MIRTVLAILSLVALFIATAIPAVAQRPGMHPGGHSRAVESVIWSGDVDNWATVFFHDDRSWVGNVIGRGVRNIFSRFNGSLPTRRSVVVQLAHVNGRGSVRLIEQPSRLNNYTAAVRIHDPQGGRGRYRFHLVWTR